MDLCAPLLATAVSLGQGQLPSALEMLILMKLSGKFQIPVPCSDLCSLKLLKPVLELPAQDPFNLGLQKGWRRETSQAWSARESPRETGQFASA